MIPKMYLAPDCTVFSVNTECILYSGSGQPDGDHEGFDKMYMAPDCMVFSVDTEWILNSVSGQPDGDHEGFEILP